jgi:outer membrane receptor protein involved in Fe transport
MRVKHCIVNLLVLVGLAFALIGSAVAQSLVSGDITGVVSDPTGAVVPNATVKLKSTATGETHTATSETNGSYRFSLLRPGDYAVTVTATGFSSLETRVVVRLGQATSLPITMTVGGQTTSVEVTAAAPIINTDNADLSTGVSENLIQNEPNGGNDLTYVAQTTPGITMNTAMGQGNFQANGLPGTANLFTVNGENDMDPFLNLNNSGATNLTLGRNDLQEATVITNAYSGQYGQQAGAQVNYITKSGSNQYHGNAIYWWTGRAMDANDWFNNHDGTPRPFANNNEWAASFGGPIRKDKTFFFVDYEGIRYIVPSSQPVYVPSQAFVTDVLSNLSAVSPNSVPAYQKMFQLYQGAPGYSSGTTFAGNCNDYTGPASLLNGGAGDCIRQYQGTPALPGTEFILSGRVDQNFSDTDRVFFRARMDHGTQDTQADPINPNFNAASRQPAYDGQSQWNHIFSPNAANQFIVATSYYRAIFTQQNAAGTFPYGSVIGGDFNLTTFGNDAFAFPQGRNVTQYQFIDDFSVTKGHHSLKFGANFRRYDLTDFVFGEFNIPEVVSLSLQDFANGSADEYVKRFPSGGFEQPIAIWGIGLYAQDEWAATKNLKLTFSLRGEHDSNPVCQTNCAALASSPIQDLADATNVNTPYNQILQAGRHQIFRSTDMINWSPRVGFAWSPGGRNTVVRGGFGIFYDSLPGAISDQYMLNLPQVAQFTLFGPAFGGSPVYWADPTASGAAAQTAASATALKSGFANGLNYTQLAASVPGFSAPTLRDAGAFHTPEFQEWSFGVEQAIGQKMSVSAMYVGNHGIHIPVLNEGLNAHGSLDFPTGKPYPMFGTVEQYNTAAVSNYNGLVTSFRRRMTYGLEFQANYSWGHAFDEVSNGGVLQANTFSSLQYQMNPLSLRQNYGPADYDIRHNFSATYVWALPYKFGNRFLQNTLGGWTMSQNFFVHSGLPFTVLDGSADISGLPTTPPAQIIASGAQTGSCSPSIMGAASCLNAAAFEPASTLGSFPTQHRNGFRGPGYFNSDFNINKSIPLTEKVNFSIGANFYNVFNHPNFANPDSNLGDAQFGQITSAVTPPSGPYGSFFVGLPTGRIIQFQGKFTF